MSPMMSNDRVTVQLNIIFFDGYCKLCSALVNFLMKADKKGIIFYSPIQSDFATLFLKKNNLGKDSVVFLFKGKIYVKSTAILKILVNLGFLWKIFYVFFIIPRIIRDAIYEFISNRRYKWFGERNSCYEPPAVFSNRLIIK